MKKTLKVAVIVFMTSCTNDGSSNNRKDIDKDYVIDPCSHITENDTLKVNTGLVKEDRGLKEVYYHNGKKNGIFKSYYKINGTLEEMGFYEDNRPVGTWYYFDQNSQIIMIEEKRGINKDKEVKRDYGVMIKPCNISYLKEYDLKSGQLKREGLALYFDDIEIDYFKYGNRKNTRL